MAPIYKIAVIQFQPTPIDVEANYAYCEAALRKAAAAGAHIALLPEYHLTSWVPEHPDFVAASAASGAVLARYQALARDLDMVIVPGTIVEAHNNSNNSSSSTLVTALDPAQGVTADSVELRNMAYCLGAGTGAVLGRYQKANLWHTERPFLTAPSRAAAGRPGSTVAWPPHAAFDIPSLVWGAAAGGDGGHGQPQRPVRAGLLVCWDLAFPEAFRALVADGADLVLIPSFWNPHLDVDAEALAYNHDCEIDFLRACLATRAGENTCAVAFCNAGGLSQLALPIVGRRGELLPGAEGISIAELDMDVLRVSEKNYRVRADMEKEDWHYAHTLQAGAAAAAANRE